MPYDNQSEYIKHNAGCDCENPESCSCEASCGCCPVGTVAVYDECGKHVGCLTPNDAAVYSVDTIDVPPGYVKVFDGDTYVGLLTVADYCAYLECTTSPAVETIHIVSPRSDADFDVNALTINSSDGNNLSGDQIFWADRNGYNGVITVAIVSADGIEFLSGGVVRTIPVEASVIRDEFEKPGTALAAGSYDITLEWRKADATVMRSQTITFIVP